MIFETIREYLNRDFETYISEWFPNARKAGNGLWRTGDFNDTKSKQGDGSLCFNTIEKYAKDFSTGETAGDIISIYAHRFCGGNQKRALDELIERYNLSYLIESSNDYNYKNNNKKGDNNYDNNRSRYRTIRSGLSEENKRNINRIDKDTISESAEEYNTRTTDTTTETEETNISSSKNIPEINKYSMGGCDDGIDNGNNDTIHITIDSNDINKTKCDIDNNKPKYTSIDKEKDSKIKNILSKIEHYKSGDPVDLYLKSRGITKYSPDTYIVNTDKMAVLVNLCNKTLTNTKKEFEETGKLYRRTDSVAGIQEIFLTREGKKRDSSATPSKIQRSYSNSSISGNPVRLSEKGDNNGYIYITEGIENGLSIQEHINNEVWCALSIVNIPTLPFENNKVYVFVLDNDYKKETKVKVNETLKDKLKSLDINYTLDNDNNIIYNIGEFNLKTTLHKLKQLKNKHFFYLIPKESGYDANDLLREKILDGRLLRRSAPRNDEMTDKLQQLLLDTPLKEIETESVLKLNKRTKEVVYWRPQKPYGTLDNDNLTKDFIGIPYDNRGLAIRFLKRFGDNYKKVDGIGICKYDNGKYNQKQEDNLFADIQQTILMTYYEYDYLIDEELKKSFKKLWIDRGVGEYKTVTNVEEYVKRSQELNVDINEFDNENNNILNLANGYYDLDKGKLIEHSKDKLFFRKLDTEYKESLNIGYIYNDWYKYLTTTFCEKINGRYENDTKGLEKIRFLQKAIGYTFSTSIKEEKLFIVKGVTRSGKNTFLDTIQEVMKDYCGDTQDEEFITSKEQNSNYLLSIRASLKGKRFLHISEIGKNKKLNGAQIKRLVGNRSITAKYMHQNSFSYKQQTKYWIATNNIDFNEFDESIKTKLFIIDFDKRFYEAGTEEAIKTGRVIDRDLKDRLLEPQNREFILKWIIEGYRLYKEEGLQQTQDMQEALDEIEADNDSLGMFVKDSMSEFDSEKQSLTAPQKNVNDIYLYYKTYEKENYDTPEELVISFRKFVKNMRNRGFVIERQWSTKTMKRELFIKDWCLKIELKNNVNNNTGE